MAHFPFPPHKYLTFMPLLLRQLLLAAAAATSLNAQALTQTELQELASSREWLNLGHYHPNTFSDGYTSQADDSDFFLSPNGKTSPEAELQATIIAVQQPGAGNDHPACRFPARNRWIRSKLDLATPESRQCPAYEEWTETLNTQTVTLVFAASYLNSPSSMFGHTFLRLDPPSDDETTDLLLANTISYAADAAAHDSELLFAYKGIFGGYPGITTVQPYYEKIRLYSDIEHRDLWEYQLNLAPAEVRQMLAHAWEIKDRNFDYYFFDENCAYRLLALIDVARPGTNLLDEVSTHAIPSDTVRWVVKKSLISEVGYRPSAATAVSYALDELPEDQQALAAELANDDLKPGAIAGKLPSTAQQAAVLDATYEYVRYQSEAEEWPREQVAPLSHSLLLARSQLPQTSTPPSPPEPEVRDDQGHDTFRASLSAGRWGERNFNELTLRSAYHDVLDPPAGYRAGAQLQFFRLDARRYTDNNELQIEKLTAVEIRSLSPRNQFFSPLSWQVGFGARRSDTGTDRVLAPYLEGGAGGSVRVSPNGQAFALATADLELDDDLNRGYDIAPGVDLGVLYQSDRLSALGGIRSKAWIVSSQHRQDQAYLKATMHWSRQVSGFAEWTREHHFDRYQSLWKLGLHIYL